MENQSYDRLVRDGKEFERIARYTEMNPAQVGVALAPEESAWSSARPIANRPQVSTCPTLCEAYGIPVSTASDRGLSWPVLLTALTA